MPRGLGFSAGPETLTGGVVSVVMDLGAREESVVSSSPDETCPRLWFGFGSSFLHAVWDAAVQVRAVLVALVFWLGFFHSFSALRVAAGCKPCFMVVAPSVSAVFALPVNGVPMTIQVEKDGEHKSGKDGFLGRCMQRRCWQKEWICKFCSGTNVRTRRRCRRYYIPHADGPFGEA